MTRATIVELPELISRGKVWVSEEQAPPPYPLIVIVTVGVPATWSLVRQKFNTPKDFALQVQSIVDPKLRGFFFQNKDKYINKDDHDMSEMSDLFDKWLKSHYQKFEWKE